MDLNLDLAPDFPRPPLTATPARPLHEGDLALLATPAGTAPAPLKRVTDRHHALARLLASGTPPGEAAVITGYTASRVSILQDDPAFAELVAFYREKNEDVYADLQARLAGLSIDAVEELRTRLEENPEALTTAQLTEIVKMAADRTGFGPSSTTNVDVRVGMAERLEAARKRVAQRPEVIDLEPVDTDDGKPR